MILDEMRVVKVYLPIMHQVLMSCTAMFTNGIAELAMFEVRNKLGTLIIASKSEVLIFFFCCLLSDNLSISTLTHMST